ncbi:MAG: translocase [Rhodospirillaceae bacterium]|nr:translocase [Rhodospirillaceae bacterium]
MGDGFAFFDIIIFAMLAGYLVFQLRRVLGRRTGHEQQRRSNPFIRQPEDNADNDNVIALTDKESPVEAESNRDDDSEMDGMTRLKSLDPDFDDREFLSGAKAAYEWTVGAFARGERDQLRDLLAPALYENFDAAIEDRERAGETLETTISSMKSTSIEAVEIDGTIVTVTVEFLTDQVKVLRSSAGDIVEGDPDRIENLTDVWLFARDVRSGDPNWQLIAIRDPEEIT